MPTWDDRSPIFPTFVAFPQDRAADSPTPEIAPPDGTEVLVWIPSGGI